MTINFIIIGFILFLIIRTMNRALNRNPQAEPTQVELLTQIRDLLKSR